MSDLATRARELAEILMRCKFRHAYVPRDDRDSVGYVDNEEIARTLGELADRVARYDGRIDEVIRFNEDLHMSDAGKLLADNARLRANWERLREWATLWPAADLVRQMAAIEQRSSSRVLLNEEKRQASEEGKNED